MQICLAGCSDKSLWEELKYFTFQCQVYRFIYLVNIYVFIYVFMYIFMYLCINLCVYVFIYVFI